MQVGRLHRESEAHVARVAQYKAFKDVEDRVLDKIADANLVLQVSERGTPPPLPRSPSQPPPYNPPSKPPPRPPT